MLYRCLLRHKVTLLALRYFITYQRCDEIHDRPYPHSPPTRLIDAKQFFVKEVWKFDTLYGHMVEQTIQNQRQQLADIL